ncbi:MAG TPA: hypothetical protein VKU41_09300 [Polyangiaceae bacterium]|nr:hypothetical protein [Polyangiaceae bacterium]
MTAPTTAPSSASRQCVDCKVDLRIEGAGQYATMYVCPKCGRVVMDPPKSPSAAG